jgi:hypothetical protein
MLNMHAVRQYNNERRVDKQKGGEQLEKCDVVTALRMCLWDERHIQSATRRAHHLHEHTCGSNPYYLS